MAERGEDANAVQAGAPTANTIVIQFLVGKLMQYTQGTDWQNYVEQLNFFFLANGVANENRKKAILMSNISAGTYQVIKDLLAPHTVHSNSRDDEGARETRTIRAGVPL